jgi:hypothetical protein
MQLLPLALAGLGTGYYVFTQAQKPHDLDETGMARWQEHMSGARFALVFGVGAAGLLWWTSKAGGHELR